MGRAALPEINSVVEVLELITNPEKYVTYLKEFRRVHQEAVSALGNVETKEKADALYVKVQADAKALAENQDAFTEAKKDHAYSLERAEDHLSQVAVDLDTKARNFDMYSEREHASILKKYAEADATAKEHAEHYAQLLAEIEFERMQLAEQKQHLDAVKAKIEPVAKALGVSLE